MSNFLRIGQNIFNVNHIVSAKRIEAVSEHAQDYKGVVVNGTPLRVELTLTAIENIDMSYDGSTYHGYAASASQTFIVSGDMAASLWDWLGRRADTILPEVQP